MIGIGYDHTFDGSTFGRWDGQPLDSHDREEILDALVARAFNLSRWQGELLFSVGEPSLVVAGLAALLATRDELPVVRQASATARRTTSGRPSAWGTPRRHSSVRTPRSPRWCSSTSAPPKTSSTWCRAPMSWRS